jgi:murein DD-endopeptidase MepM/ murein hydrolase activator NlpD
MRKPFDSDFPLTQGFNDPTFRYFYYQFNLLGHNGLDYGTPVWTPILAPHKGTVLEASTGTTGYGNYVKVQSADEGSVLGHLSKISVTEGQEVEEGQLIGYSGNSGASTGPHLHWGYYRTRTRNRQNGFNGYIDQTDWLDFKPAVIPQEIAITDQTKIPQLDNQEVQAIKSKLSDNTRDIDSLTKQLAKCQATAAVSPQKPQQCPSIANSIYTYIKRLLG